MQSWINKKKMFFLWPNHFTSYDIIFLLYKNNLLCKEKKIEMKYYKINNNK